MHRENIIIYREKPKESTKKDARNNNFSKMSELKVNTENVRINIWKLKLKNNNIYNGIKMYEVLRKRFNKIFSRSMHQKLYNIAKRK